MGASRKDCQLLGWMPLKRENVSNASLSALLDAPKEGERKQGQPLGSRIDVSMHRL